MLELGVDGFHLDLLALGQRLQRWIKSTLANYMNRRSLEHSISIEVSIRVQLRGGLANVCKEQ